jgi:hypothetical protein
VVAFDVFAHHISEKEEMRQYLTREIGVARNAPTPDSAVARQLWRINASKANGRTGAYLDRVPINRSVWVGLGTRAAGRKGQ